MQSSSQCWDVRWTCLKTLGTVGTVVGRHGSGLDVDDGFGTLLLFLVMLFSNSWRERKWEQQCMREMQFNSRDLVSWILLVLAWLLSIPWDWSCFALRGIDHLRTDDSLEMGFKIGFPPVSSVETTTHVDTQVLNFYYGAIFPAEGWVLALVIRATSCFWSPPGPVWCEAELSVLAGWCEFPKTRFFLQCLVVHCTEWWTQRSCQAVVNQPCRPQRSHHQWWTGDGWKGSWMEDVPSADARFFFQFLANSVHDSVFFFKVRWLDTRIQVPLIRGLKGAWAFWWMF